MAYVLYRDKEKPKDSWIRFLHYRIFSKNQNNLIIFVGKTGSGKTYSAISVSEKLSKRSKVHFGIENIVFSLKELLSLINSNKLRKGSTILFDEPQISISNREFQSKANKLFNYLISTFRHKNFNVLFCTPYENLLDKSTRKLFHAKFVMEKIDIKKKLTIIRPFLLQYNSGKDKFYEKYLRVKRKPEGMSVYLMKPLKLWSLPKPDEELIKLYEKKKKAFTTALNLEIEAELDVYENGKKKALFQRGDLTDKQKRVLKLTYELKDKKKVAEVIGISTRVVYDCLKACKKKGWTPKDYYLENLSRDGYQ